MSDTPFASFAFTPVTVVDSHTAGEPTRIIVEGGPDLGSGDLRAKLAVLRTRFDEFRAKVLLEPRGSEVLVGGLLCEPQDKRAITGVIFFNDVGYLGMCGHGTIGLITTLAHMGRITPGTHRIETPVGLVTATLNADCSVSVQNVPSYRYRDKVEITVAGLGTFQGDIAWGGNWFYLVEKHPFTLVAANRSELVSAAKAIRQALAEAGIAAEDGAVIDHIEFSTAPADAANSDRNFVLCPGEAFDRSPCGTGTSAKMACLYAEHRLMPGEVWRQEGILGTVFEGTVSAMEQDLHEKVHEDIDRPGTRVEVLPTITGRAYITAETKLLFDSHDPFAAGITF